MFSKCFTGVLHFIGHDSKAAHSVPLHLKIVRKAFETNSFSFWLFLQCSASVSQQFLHFIGHDAKAAHSVPLHLENSP